MFINGIISFLFFIGILVIRIVFIVFVIFIIIEEYKKFRGNNTYTDETIDKKNVNNVINKNRPLKVMVPDNVKRNSQKESTQKEDAKVFDVLNEKRMLESKGYKKTRNTNEYIKRDGLSINNADDYITNEKEFDPINNRDDNYKPLNDNEDDDDPIKDL